MKSQGVSIERTYPSNTNTMGFPFVTPLESLFFLPQKLVFGCPQRTCNKALSFFPLRFLYLRLSWLHILVDSVFTAFPPLPPRKKGYLHRN